jgi:hypothetical protein
MQESGRPHLYPPTLNSSLLFWEDHRSLHGPKCGS